MTTVDYFSIIHKYIDPHSLTYAFYIPHVASVTTKAIRLGLHMGLDAEQLRFVEEAAMLHDIGIVKVRSDRLGCHGDLPYISHLAEGRKILEHEGLPRHALVAARHVGLGLTKEEISEKKFPLPPEDLFPETIEEHIISWADLFFSKAPGQAWREKSLSEVRQTAIRYGPRALRTFEKWAVFFGEAGSA